MSTNLSSINYYSRICPKIFTSIYLNFLARNKRKEKYLIKPYAKTL